MTYTPPDGSREEALLRNLRAGLPMLRARFAAGFKTLAALPTAIESTPGLAEAIGEAEVEGARVRAKKKDAGARKEAGDGKEQMGAQGDTRAVASAVREGEDHGADPSAKLRHGFAAGAPEVPVPREVARPVPAAVAPDASGGASDGGTVAQKTKAPDAWGESAGADERREEIGNPRGSDGEAASPLPIRAEATTPPAVVNVRELAARLDREARASVSLVENDVAADSFEPDDDSPGAERWARIREEAAALAAGLLGFVLWVDRCRVDSRTGLYAMDPAWVRHFDGFYASGEFEDIGRFGVRAAKSDSVCTAITGETLLIRRTLAGSIVGVCPVMSANMREAGDRFDTVKANLRACGFRDLSGTKEAVDAFAFKASGGGNSALVVETFDSQGHAVEFRVYPASESGAAGFTGIAGFGDELDLWGKAQGANPASKVLRVLRSRYTTQPEAKLHLMSATYDRESEHARLVAAGNIPGQYVARLGKEGAAKDHADRLRLAALIQSADPLLLAPPLPPECPDIPSWVTNPVAPIESAFKKSKGDLREMFALYGGRLALAGGAGAMTLDDARFILDQNRTLAEPLGQRLPGALRDDGLLHVHGYDNDPGAVPGRYRGL